VGTIQAEIEAVESFVKRLGFGVVGMVASWFGH
jgi:hypothetical protein